MKYSHQYGCLDDSRNELQQILKSLDATIGCRIASLHCRILEEQQQQLITGDNEQSTKSGNTQQQQESERGNIIQKKHNRGGEWDHPERSNVGKINDNEDNVC